MAPLNGRGASASRRGDPIGRLALHRVGVAILLALWNATPGMPDDRQLLLQSGANDMRVILDSSTSLARDFVDHFDLPILASTDVAGSTTIAAPALPALPVSSGDEALMGSVIPSHRNPTPKAGDGSSARWAIWNGSLKAFRLDSRGLIPTVAPSATAMPRFASAPGYPDETAPNDTKIATRKPVWNAGRVLGYTSPMGIPQGGDTPSAAGANAPAITVWPGRRMLWGDGGGPSIPVPRKEFQPNTGDCTGTNNPGECFYDLMQAMGLDPTVSADVTKAVRTVNFLRGGKTANGSRDEILTELGAANPGTYGTVNPNTPYSYRYQDDIPKGNLSSAQTETSDPKSYSHKLGDIFHSETAVLLPPKYFQYISSNLTPKAGACGTLKDCSYDTFRRRHQFRRKVAFVGSNDGFLHAFEAGVYDRDNDPSAAGPSAGHPFNDHYDLGTGREIFAFAPRAVMKLNGSKGFSALLNFPPKVQYFVDGSPVLADVFLDTQHAGTPDPANRTWKTVLVSGLRQGGRHYFALDVTQPDIINADGTKTAGKDTFPDCVDAPENGDGNCAARYPKVLWELTDDCTPGVNGCVSPIGETWSRPVLGRIKVGGVNGAVRDRYVAIFGGGFDSTFVPGTEVPVSDTSTRGRSIYIVNIETGAVIYKATAGKDAGNNEVRFAPVPAPPAVADVNDDGYLDVAYFGDLNGRMWRLDLSQGVSDTGTANATLTGFSPFLLYDGLSENNTQRVQPVFMEAGLIFVSGGVSPVIGVAWGSGYRAELLSENPNVQRFTFVADPADNSVTFDESELINITPEGGQTPAGTNRVCENGPCSYFLDFAVSTEKAVSTVFSTFGTLSLTTFRPRNANELCGHGLSARYKFHYKTGVGGYGTTVQLGSYKEELGEGLASLSQSQGPGGQLNDTILFSDGRLKEEETGHVKTLSDNWKEQ